MLKLQDAIQIKFSEQHQHQRTIFNDQLDLNWCTKCADLNLISWGKIKSDIIKKNYKWHTYIDWLS